MTPPTPHAPRMPKIYQNSFKFLNLNIKSLAPSPPLHRAASPTLRLLKKQSQIKLVTSADKHMLVSNEQAMNKLAQDRTHQSDREMISQWK